MPSKPGRRRDRRKRKEERGGGRGGKKQGIEIEIPGYTDTEVKEVYPEELTLRQSPKGLQVP